MVDSLPYPGPSQKSHCHGNSHKDPGYSSVHLERLRELNLEEREDDDESNIMKEFSRS